MKKTLYLHIGYHKTGTTSIQNFFWNNRKILSKESDLLYPEIGNSGPTHAQFALCLPSGRDKIISEIASVKGSEDDNPYAGYTGPEANDLYQELGKEIERTDCKRILLSSECFLEWIRPDVISKHLREYCDCNVKIIVYLRRQDQWIQSVYNQVIKDPFIRYAGELEELPQISMLDYFGTLMTWAEEFNRDNIIVRSYERSALLEHGTISDMLNLLNLNGIKNYNFSMSIKDKNKSLESKQVKILHALNKKEVQDEIFRLVLSYFEYKNEEISTDNWPAVFMSHEEASNLYKKYIEDNDRISNEFMNGENNFHAPTEQEYMSIDQTTPDEIADLVEFLFSSNFKSIS